MDKYLSTNKEFVMDGMDEHLIDNEESLIDESIVDNTLHFPEQSIEKSELDAHCSIKYSKSYDLALVQWYK
jgi:hypothetical protein